MALLENVGSYSILHVSWLFTKLQVYYASKTLSSSAEPAAKMSSFAASKIVLAWGKSRAVIFFVPPTT